MKLSNVVYCDTKEKALNFVHKLEKHGYHKHWSDAWIKNNHVHRFLILVPESKKVSIEGQGLSSYDTRDTWDNMKVITPSQFFSNSCSLMSVE